MRVAARATPSDASVLRFVRQSVAAAQSAMNAVATRLGALAKSKRRPVTILYFFGRGNRVTALGVKSAAIVCAFLLGSLPVALAPHDVQASQTPHLERPTGRYAVSRIGFDWVDSRRPEDLADDKSARRELMVYIWYPSEPGTNSKPAPLLPGLEEIRRSPNANREVMNSGFRNVWALVVANKISSGALQAGPPAQSPTNFPIVLFSPGDRVTSFSYSSFIEEIVSHGYIVVAIEYTYQSAAVAFPDGRVVPYSDKNRNGMSSPPGTPQDEQVRKAMTWIRQRADVMAADQGFVIDQLAKLNSQTSQSFLAGRFDLNRVASLGHSSGGQASARACQLDPRIRICANLDGGTVDGALLRYDGAPPIAQPFLYAEVPFVPYSAEQLEKMNLTRTQWRERWAETIEKQLKSSTKEAYAVVIDAPSITHLSFTDTYLLSAPDAASRNVAVRNLALLEQVTLAFLDKYLTGDTHTIFDVTSQRPSEVQIKEYAR